MCGMTGTLQHRMESGTPAATCIVTNAVALTASGSIGSLH
jgi:hypothetical protein